MTPLRQPVRTPDDIASNEVFSSIGKDQRNTLRSIFSSVGIDAADEDPTAVSKAVRR